MTIWTTIAAEITAVTGQPFQIHQHRSVGGGSINQACAVTDGDRTYFVKINQASQLPMFEAEALGLREIESTQTIRVPKALCWGTVNTSAYLVLEWLDLGHAGGSAWAAMGRQLAAMHQVISQQGFGWKQNNTIGSTPQLNPWTADWVNFFTEHRLRYQFQLAKRRGGHFPLQDRLLAAIPDLLAGHRPQPALVHGDLWSGNAAVTHQGKPVLLDPAVYYGDREVDLAMTELFGGFPRDFYSAYQAVYPLDPGYEQRKILYNLYHVVNHFNLFGSGYESQANRMTSELVR